MRAQAPLYHLGKAELALAHKTQGLAAAVKAATSANAAAASRSKRPPPPPILPAVSTHADGRPGSGGSLRPESIKAQLEASLAVLALPAADIFFIHGVRTHPRDHRRPPLHHRDRPPYMPWQASLCSAETSCTPWPVGTTGPCTLTHGAPFLLHGSAGSIDASRSDTCRRARALSQGQI